MTANAPDRPNFLFDRQKVVIADRFDRERWERYFEPWARYSAWPCMLHVSKWKLTKIIGGAIAPLAPPPPSFRHCLCTKIGAWISYF
jgi:hypothetical protein